MTDNLAMGPDAQTNHVISILRDGSSSGQLSHDTPLAPEISFKADDAAPLEGRFTSPAGRLLELNVRYDDATPAWAAIHFTVSAMDMSAFGLIGLACRTAAPEVLTVQPCLRSGTEQGFVDCFFSKHILSHPREHSHLDALSFHRNPNLPRLAPWRELVLFLPNRSLVWTLQDLRLFIV